MATGNRYGSERSVNFDLLRGAPRLSMDYFVVSYFQKSFDFPRRDGNPAVNKVRFNFTKKRA